MVNKRLLSLCDESKKWIGMTVLMNWISIICNIAIVVYIGNVIDKLYNNDFNINILGSAVFIVAMLGIRFVCNFLSTKFSSKSSTEVRKGLRSKIYQKLLDLGVNYKDTISTSSTVQISVDGVEALEIYFGRYLPQLFYSLLAPLTLFVVVAPISFKAAIVLLICVPLIPVSIVAVMKFAKKLLGKYWGIYTNLGDSFLENLHGLTTLKIYDLDEEKNEEMNKEAENFRNITIGQVLIIILLSSEFFIPLRLLGSYFHVAMNGMAASDKIFNLLDAEIEKIENLTKEEMNLLKDINIEIKNVDFSYDKERKVLKNVNVTIPKGKMIALVGESGCGKSTITNLLLKQEKVDSGEITLNGIDLNYIPFEVLTKKVGFINHSAYIFNGTIEDNLRMGKFDANEREINEALKKANLYDFVQSLPEKLQTNVGEGGSLLSGGQKQRLALARTIITNPEIYIFDEATSNIDVESEEKIWRSIYELSENKTVIVISHRLANVKNADNIYVLDKGNIVESGSHKDLMMYNGKYAQLVNHQNNLESIYNDELTQKEVAISE